MSNKLTLCLIARDEEQMLPGCLASVRDVVAQMVVVDTGSVDRTREVACAAGAQVFEFTWRNDFAAARNEALRHATGDWILVLDADERLAPGAGDAIRRAIRGARFDVGLLRLHSATAADAPLDAVLDGGSRIGEPLPVPRLLRRAPDLAYTGIVHESVREWLLARRGRAASVDADVVHLGADPALRQQRGKRERNVALLRAACHQSPRDVTRFGYLALELLESGQLDEAATVAEAGWNMMADQPADVSIHHLAVARAQIAIGRGQPDVACTTADEADARQGPTRDLAYLRALALEAASWTSAPAASASLARRAAREYERAGEVTGTADGLVTAARTPERLVRLGTASLVGGDPARAARAFAEALARDPGNRGALLGRMEAALDQGDAAAALAIGEPLLDERPDGWTLAAAAAHALGATADAALLARCARDRLAAGFVAPHRHARLAALAAA